MVQLNMDTSFAGIAALRAATLILKPQTCILKSTATK